MNGWRKGAGFMNGWMEGAGFMNRWMKREVESGERDGRTVKFIKLGSLSILSVSGVHGYLYIIPYINILYV